MNEDDLLLLLMSSAPPDRKIKVIRVHGIESGWDRDFQTRLSALCLDPGVRAELNRQFRKRALSAAAPHEEQPAQSNEAPLADQALPPPAAPDLQFPGPGAATTACENPLAAPDERLLQRIVERFTANDARLLDLLKHYTYHQSLLARQMDPSGSVLGSHYREWDVLFNDQGKRVFREVTYSPDSLGNHIHLLKETKAEGIPPLTFVPEDLQEYAFHYLDHSTLDRIGVYRLSVEPKRIKRGNRYFKGVIWIEDRSLQIVKTEGDTVPSFVRGPFGWHFYPHYVTFRTQVEGVLWFPTLAVSEGTVNGIRLNIVTKYFDYRRFGSESRLTTDLGEYDEEDQK